LTAAQRNLPARQISPDAKKNVQKIRMFRPEMIHGLDQMRMEESASRSYRVVCDTGQR